MKISFNLNKALKAHEVLSEAACIKAVEDARKLEGRLRIPVTMRGVLVGTGELRRDGTFIVETESSPEGQELMQRILTGSANCIAIAPNPMGPVVRSSNPERN